MRLLNKPDARESTIFIDVVQRVLVCFVYSGDRDENPAVKFIRIVAPTAQVLPFNPDALRAFSDEAS